MSKTTEDMYSEVVWAKCGSFPWWPSFIYDPNKLPITCSKEVKNRAMKLIKKKYTFFYLGDVNYGFTSPSLVKPYNEENKKEFCKQKIPTSYLESFEKGLQLADMQSALPKSERLSWHYTNAGDVLVSDSKGPASVDGEETKRRRGRPPKKMKTDDTDDQSAVSEAKSKESKEPKRRGRPPKKAKADVSDEYSAVSDIKSSSQQVTEVKRRGRPPKNFKKSSNQDENKESDLYFQESKVQLDRDSAAEEDNESHTSSSSSSEEVEELQSVSEEVEDEEEEGSVASSGRNEKKRKLDSSSSAEPLQPVKRGRGRPKKASEDTVTSSTTAKNVNKASKEVVNEVESEEEEESNRVVRSRPSTNKPVPTSVTNTFAEESILERLTRFANILRLCSENNDEASIARAVKILDKLAALKDAVSEELLRSSGVGKLVSVSLRKHSHADISERAAALRSSWMAIVKGEPQQQQPAAQVTANVVTPHNSSTTPLPASATGSNSSNHPVSTTATPAVATTNKPNPFRARAVRLLREAVASSSAGVAAGNSGEVAFAVEKAAFDGFGASHSHYFEFITRTAQSLKSGQEESDVLLEKLRNGQLHTCMVFASPS